MSVNHWLDGLRFQFAMTGRSRTRKRRLQHAQSAQIASESLENRLLLTTTYINAGGPNLAGDPSFVEDDSFQNGVGRSFGRNRAIDMSMVDSNLPMRAFQSVLWDNPRGAELQFDIPATPGSEYQIDLLFSEIWGGAFRPGVRIFDVAIEGSTVLDNFDIFGEVGARKALVKSFNVTATDGNLDIDLSHVANNPAIAGIIVTDLTGGGGGQTNTPPTISSIANQTVDENQSVGPLSFTVGDIDGDAITVTSTSNNSALVPQNAVSVTGSGSTRTVTVTPLANESGVATITLLASDGQATVTEPFTVTVNDAGGPVDPPMTDPRAMLLNAGGSAVGDFVSAASVLNRVRTNNPRRGAIANVPDGIPTSVFRSNAWTPRRFGDLQFNIPTQTGTEYRVDLLFAEKWGPAFRPGVRQFDVSIDGQQVLNDFDIFAEAGARTALVKSFNITGDGNLDIDLSHVANNPVISGVIVTPLNGDGGPAANLPPVLNPISNKTVVANTPLQFTATATDPNGDNLTYSIVTQGLPGAPTINPQLGAFAWTPPNAGNFNVTLQVSDGSLTDTKTFSVTVTAAPQANRPPVLAEIPNQQATVGTALTFAASATDPDPGDTVQYFLNPAAPAGATINSVTGAVTWTPTTGQIGSVSFPVFATDGQLDVSKTVNVTVSAAPNRPPVLAAIGNRTVTVGQTLTFTATATDPDVPADMLQFSLGPNAPAGATINATTGAFAWTPTGSGGPVSFAVEVSDGTASDSEIITVTVVANQAPTIAPISDQTVQEGTLLQLTVMATDPNPNDTLTYSLMTTGLPGNPQVNPSTGVFTWTPPAENGPGDQVTVRVTDAGGLFDTVSFTIVVTAAPSTNTPPVLDTIPVQTAMVGQLLTFTATATDADVPPDTLSFLLDPTAPNGAAINISTGVFTWTPTAAGTFTIPVVVDDGTDSDSQNVTVNVTASSPNQAPTFGPVANQVVNVNEQLQFTLLATDPDGDPLTFTLLTTNLPGVAQVNASTGQFTWTPNQIGPAFDVTVQVTDAGGLSDTVTFAVTVNDAGPGGNTAPVIAVIPNQDAEPGVLLTFTVVATDADGDPLSFFLDPTAPTGADIDSNTGVFTWTPSPGDLGPASFPVFVSDGTDTVFRNVSVIVSEDGGGGGGGGPNSAPSFGPQNDYTIAATATLAVTITADDPDAGDTLTYSLVTTNLPGDPTVNPQTGVFTWTPPSSAAETTFQVMIRATDQGGLSDEALFNVNVLAEGPGGGGGGGGANRAPVMNDIPDQEATVGTLLTFNVVATDADGDILDYFFDPTAPSTASISPAGVFTWTPSAGDVGTVVFPIFVWDGQADVFRNVTIVVSA